MQQMLLAAACCLSNILIGGFITCKYPFDGATPHRGCQHLIIYSTAKPEHNNSWQKVKIKQKKSQIYHQAINMIVNFVG